MSDVDYALLAGKKLRELIKENCFTQEDFADDFGLDIRSVNRYINNGISKVATIQQLAVYFDVPFTVFFTE